MQRGILLQANPPPTALALTAGAPAMILLFQQKQPHTVEELLL